MSDPREPCTSPEDLAALAEGRLRAGPRDRVVGHLAACVECREAFAGTLRVLAEVGAGEGVGAGGAEPAPARRARAFGASRPGWRPAVVAALAAGLLVAAGVVAWQRLAAPAPPDRAAWLAALPPAERLVPELWGGVVLRGGETGTALPRQSAELGALLVDVEVALAARDAGRASELLRRMAAIVDDAGLLDDEAERLRRLAAEPAGQLLADLSSELPALEEGLRQRFLSFHLDLGAFAEQANLAVAAGRGDLLRGGPARRYVAWALAQEQPLSPAARAGLEALGREEATAEQRRRAAADLLRGLTR